MPQTDFYLTELDASELVVFILDQGAWLVPDLRYEEPNYTIISTINDYIACRKVTKMVFILHDSFLRCPLEMRAVEKQSGDSGFFIMQKNGGPTIDFFCPGDFERGRTRSVGPSMIGYHKTYWNTTRRANEKVPAELTVLYKSIIKKGKEGAEKITGKNRTYWVGKHALEAWKAGVELIGAPGAVRRA